MSGLFEEDQSVDAKLFKLKQIIIKPCNTLLMAGVFIAVAHFIVIRWFLTNSFNFKNIAFTKSFRLKQ